MKTMKVALLATAALAAVSVAARADDTAAIKAQLEALNARIAQLEATPSLPTGYSLLTASEVAPLVLTGEKASDRTGISHSNRISILPTADAPAASTIDWDLEVRAAITHTNNAVTRAYTTNTTTPTLLASTVADTTPAVTSTTNSDSSNINVRGRIRVKASTDTSVGTVGVDMRIQGSSEFGGGADVVMNIAWGWWQMTPEWTLGGGYTGTLADPGHGMDGWATFGTTVAFGTGDQEQFRLTYASGPLTWAVAIEDADDRTLHGVTHVVGDNAFAVASRLDYAGDAFAASLSGYYKPEKGKNLWQVAAGADFALGDIANLSVNGAAGSYGYGATVFAGFDVTDTTSFEASAGHVWYKGTDDDVTKINAGIFWKPVDQLKMGIQADHIINHGDVTLTPAPGAGIKDTTSVSFVTWFSY